MSRGNALRWCRCEVSRSSASTRSRGLTRYQEQTDNLWAALLVRGGRWCLGVLVAVQERWEGSGVQ